MVKDRPRSEKTRIRAKMKKEYEDFMKELNENFPEEGEYFKKKKVVPPPKVPHFDLLNIYKKRIIKR